MTWIRWDTGTPRAEVVGFLADRLGCQLAQALGHYNALCCGFGDHRRDGCIDRVTDVTLEGWALWIGKPGKFAQAIRDWCKQNEDSPGKLRGWWRNEATLRKQEKDATRPNGSLRKAARDLEGDPARENGGNRGGNDDEDGNDLRTTTASSSSPAVQAAVAANDGLRTNSAIRGFNELLPQQADQYVKDWMGAGIPLAMICAVIRQRCAAYKPGVNGTQPSSFSYFDQAIRQAHQRALGTAQLAAVPSPKPTSKLRDLTEDLSA